MSLQQKVSFFFLGFLGFTILLFSFLFPDLHSQQTFNEILNNPSLDNWFGTDHLGRDVLSRLVYGAKISIGLAVVTSLIAVSLGLLVGVVAGYLGGWIDRWIMRMIDAVLSLPDLLLIILISLYLSKSFWGLSLSLSILSWAYVARLVRAETRRAIKMPFMEASVVLGTSRRRQILLHLIPILGPMILVTIMYRIPIVIVEEATLSFLGLGIRPPETSWGLMASESWGFLEQYPLLVLLPCMCISVTVLCFYGIANFLESYWGYAAHGPEKE